MSFLKEAIKNEKIASAYLFVGPQGSGKRKTALEFTKELTGFGGNHPDIFLIEKGDSASIKIEQIRFLREKVALKPYEAPRKVFIICDAQDMTEEASNALLKTLEEPPPNNVIILLSTSINRMLLTILSRCQIIKFAASQDAYEAFRLPEIDTLSVNEIKQKDKKDTIEILKALAFWYRDILIAKSGCRKTLMINQSKLGIIKQKAQALSLSKVIEIIDEIAKTIFLLERNVNVKLALQCLSIKMEQ